MKEIAPKHLETLVDADLRKGLPTFFIMVWSIAIKPVVRESEFDSDYTAGSSTR